MSMRVKERENLLFVNKKKQKNFGRKTWSKTKSATETA